MCFYNGNRKDATMILDVNVPITNNIAIKDGIEIIYDSILTIYGLKRGSLRNVVAESEVLKRDIIFIADCIYDVILNEVQELVLYEVDFSKYPITVKVNNYLSTSSCDCLKIMRSVLSKNIVFCNNKLNELPSISTLRNIDMHKYIFVNPFKVAQYKCFSNVHQILNLIDSFRSKIVGIHTKFDYKVVSDCDDCKSHANRFLKNGLNLFENYTPEFDRPTNKSLCNFLRNPFDKSSNLYSVQKLGYETSFIKNIIKKEIDKKTGKLADRVNIISQYVKINGDYAEETKIKLLMPSNKLNIFVDNSDDKMEDNNDYFKMFKGAYKNQKDDIPMTSYYNEELKDMKSEDVLKKASDFIAKMEEDKRLAKEQEIKNSVKEEPRFDKEDIEWKFPEKHIAQMPSVINHSKAVSSIMVINKVLELAQVGSIILQSYDKGTTPKGFCHEVVINHTKIYTGYGPNKSSAKRNAYQEAVIALGYYIVD